MTSRRARYAAAPLAPALSLALSLAVGLTACGGDDGKDTKATPSPTRTAGVTLTPGGTELALGKVARFAWAPNQNVSGLVALTVEEIVQGSPKDTAKVAITPMPKKLYLYYVRVHLENLGKDDLGGIAPVTLPLNIDDGSDMVRPPADIDARLRFTACPASVLPKRFGKGAEADACLVYASAAPIRRLVLLPPSGDLISWSGEVTRPTPPRKPSATPSAAR